MGLKIFIMFLIAFTISMFVAAIIKLLYVAISSNQIRRYYDKQLQEEYRRAKRIKKIRTYRALMEFKKMEKAEQNEILNHFYGDKDSSEETEKMNEILNHFYSDNDNKEK